MKQFIDSYNALVLEFAHKYYGKEAYVENILLDNDKYFFPIEITDTYWSINDIFLCMQLDIPQEIVHNWTEFAYNDYLQNGKITLNLYHFYLNNKGK